MAQVIDRTNHRPIEIFGQSGTQTRLEPENGGAQMLTMGPEVRTGTRRSAVKVCSDQGEDDSTILYALIRPVARVLARPGGAAFWNGGALAIVFGRKTTVN